MRVCVCVWGGGGRWWWWCALNRYNVVITVSSGILLSIALVCDTWIVISVVSLVGLFVMIMHAFRDLVKDDTLIIIIIICWRKSGGGKKTAVSNVV